MANHNLPHYNFSFEVVDAGDKINLYYRDDSGVLRFLDSGKLGGRGFLSSWGEKGAVTMKDLERAVDDALSKCRGGLGQEFTCSVRGIRTDDMATGYLETNISYPRKVESGGH